MAKFRKFLIGAERAEFEAVHGALATDALDARFVLVDEDQSEKIDEFVEQFVVNIGGPKPQRAVEKRAAVAEATDEKLSEDEAKPAKKAAAKKDEDK